METRALPSLPPVGRGKHCGKGTGSAEQVVLTVVARRGQAPSPQAFLTEPSGDESSLFRDRRPRVFRFSWLLVVLCAAMGGAAQAQVNRRHTETLLAPFPPEVYDSAVVSPDGRRIAYVEQAGDRQAAVIDGNREQAYDRVAALTFSPNSQWHAYAASAGGRWLLVVNGASSRPMPE